MHRRIPIKNYLHEIQLVTNRAITALVLMSILVLLLIIRLGYLQLAKHDLYTTLSQKNSVDLLPVEPTRGLIFDRNGVLLAENIPVFSLDIIPDKVDNLPQTLSEISKIIPLTDIEIAQFQKQLKQHRRFDGIPLKLRLAEEEVAKLSENLYRFPGATVKARLMRHYPLGSSFIHVLGYVGRINTQDLNEIDPTNYSASNYIGKLGIEKYYEDELHGAVGYEQVENDASGEPVRVLNRIKPTPGENLFLTIDSKLQLAVEQILEGHKGSVVVIQPSTGQILAMVSFPTYDPNVFVTGISSQDFKTLQQSPEKPLYNRVLRGLYPFASTIKPYIALQGLNTGTTDTVFTLYDPGWYQLKNSSHIFRDWRKRGHGVVNIMRAITSSCDTYFFDLSFKLGIKQIDNILTEFGFGQLTGIDLGEELPGVVSSPEWKRRVKGTAWYPGDTIISGIGQGSMQTTPLQLAVGVATIANRGERYTPYLLLAEQEPNKALNYQNSHKVKTIELSDKKYWDIVIESMQDVTRSPEGTAYNYFKDVPYTVAAKTGTAQLYSRKHVANESDHEDQSKIAEQFRDHSLIEVFAPVDKPKIAVAVIMENSKLAASVSRKILDYYLIGPETLTSQTAPSDSNDNTSETTEEETNDVH